ncbi:MAG: sigma 54-interacting transcriptional regulator, partial [Lachnospiraceae bacterium]|nr:sigma 54-interacting transcriptional regulator [Lachnospiraceae bacterium]
VNMYPVYENRRIVGGVSVVTFIRDAFDASKELERVEKLSRQILHRVNKTNTVHYSFDSIVAESPAAKECKQIAQKAATTDATVMLLSESGTGKELYAQAIHSASARRKEPFVAVNCANFNGTMMESELFGYVEGAFTGAKKGGRIGLFEAANGGTLFLDEVSEIEIPLQAKLLRALQEGRIRPVGGVEEKEIDVRVISASNADMEERITQGSFRTDLFYRLSTFQIRIPPLRKRRLCIPALTRDILDELSGKLHTGIKITDEAMRALMGYDWPGNIRELRNVLELSAYFAEDGTVTRRSLPDQIIRNSANAVSERLSDRVKRFEKEEILRLLKVNGNTLEGKKKTAKELGISLSSLYNKIGDGI